MCMRIQKQFPVLMLFLVSLLSAMAGVQAESHLYPRSIIELDQVLRGLDGESAQRLADQIKKNNDTNLVAMVTQIVITGQQHTHLGEETGATESYAVGGAIWLLYYAVDEQTYLPLLK